MPVLVNAGKATVPAYALLDSGASCSAISTSLCLQIEAPTEKRSMTLSTFNNKDVSEKPLADFYVSDLSETLSFHVTKAIVGEIFSVECEIPPYPPHIATLPHLKDIQFPTIPDGSVQLILGVRLARAIFKGEVREGGENDPLAMFTPFGPVLAGPVNKSTEAVIDADAVVDANVCALESELDENLDEDCLSEQIRRVFRHDFIMKPEEVFPPEKSHPSAMDEQSLRIMRDSIHLDESRSQYVVDLPWALGRQQTADLFRTVNFYENALSRQNKLRQKFMKDPKLRQGSFAQVQMNIDNGYSRILTEAELEADPRSPVCYLPNVIARHDDKPDKYRVCQDATAKVKGHSLNRYLLSGPDNLNNLIGILTRCRQGRYIVTADIKDFFYQVRLNDLDAPALRYLWWTDESMSQIMVLEGTVHLFGVTSSPTVSTFAFRHHFDTIPTIPDWVRDVVNESFYVDDLMHGFNDANEGMMLKNYLNDAVKAGGFNLVKWKSTCPGLTDDDRSTSLLTPSSDPTVVGVPAAGDKIAQTGADAKTEARGAEMPAGATDVDQAADAIEASSSMEEHDDETISELVERTLKGENHDLNDFKGLTTDATTKLLGVGFSFDADAFFIKLRNKHSKEVKTKAEVLSLIASVYDPLGLVAPFVLTSRLIFQKLNEMQIGWKQRVPQEILDEIIKWRDSIPNLKHIVVPRWTSALGYEDSEAHLVCFADASTEGYGCCAYVRRTLKGGGTQAHVSFLMSKAHVVPIQMARKPVANQENHCDSIPRLELVAALSSAMLRDILHRESRETYVTTTMFSDSVTVLRWVGNFQRRFKTFENFRLQKIRNLTDVSDWRHCPTDSNPADLCSKGIQSHEYNKFKFLHTGPDWLAKDANEWPPKLPLTVTGGENEAEPSTEVSAGLNCITYSIVPREVDLGDEVDEVLVAPIHLLTGSSQVKDDDATKFDLWPLKMAERRSVWPAKVRFIALFRKTLKTWIQKHREKKTSPTTPAETRRRTTASKVRVVLTLNELNEAEKLLLKAVQNCHFASEIETLVRLNIVGPNATTELKTRSSRLTSLAPFVDEDNLLRAGSRFQDSAHLSYETQFPIILPGSRDENVRSLIRHVHEKNLHCSKIQTYFQLKLRYFILGGKTAVGSVLANCLACQKLKKSPSPQRMGNLPTHRVNIVAPFENAGLDVFGPYETKVGRTTKKRWALVVTCMSTRAVCLLPLVSMNTDCAVRALVKFSSLYPGVKNVFSDQGTNFKSADKEMRNAMALWNDAVDDPALHAAGINWSFGPANCGAVGGVWERVIQIAKNHLKAVLKNRIVDADSFETLLFAVAGIMNRRPLTPASTDVDDLMVLSPAHFLNPHLFVNNSNSVLPPAPADARTLRGSWQETRTLIDIFWRTWSRSYLEELRKRTRWTNVTNGPKMGQLVLVTDPNLPREFWRTARVVDVLGSDKNIPRRFVVEDAKKRRFDRHATGLVPLELEAEKETET